MMKLKKHLAGLLMSGAVLFGGVALVSTPTPAVAQEGEEGGQRRRSETLDPTVAKALQTIFEQMQADQYQAALQGLNGLLAERGDRMKPFDKATTLELRGSVKVNLEDYRGAMKDFQDALALNALPPERNNQLRYFIAQLQFQTEDYQGAIRGLTEWIRTAQAAGQTVDANAYYLLAAAYASLEPPNYRSCVQPAEQTVALRNPPKKGDHDLLNLCYSETNENAKRAALLEKMINLWPSERSYWTQLSGLYSTTGKDVEAFSVLEVAYRAGLLTREAELLTLIQYYSFYDNPFRGAQMLEREMQAGNIARNQKNLVLLSQLWSQSREHKRAIPVLREAANASSDGVLSYRLGQVLLADEQYVEAERALEAALRKGGMNAQQTGDVWLLLGTARFSQAGPGDRAKRRSAREAFSNATRYPGSARQARDWVTYIDAINRTEEDQDRLEKAQRIEQLSDEIERLKTQAQVCRLQREANCEQFIERSKQLEAEREALQKGAAPAAAEEAAPAPDGETPAEEPAAEETTGDGQ